MDNKMTLLLVVVVVVAGLGVADSFSVRGRVYCDTCQFSFETNVTTYIPEARVRVQCVKREDVDTVVYTTEEAVTDKTGSYQIEVEEDRGDEMCHAVLVRSPWPHCRKPDPKRHRSPVTLTNSNGLISPIRHANNLGFLINHPLPVCAPLLHYYLHAYE